MSKARIRFARIGKTEQRFVEDRLDDNRLRLLARSQFPPEQRFAWPGWSAGCASPTASRSALIGSNCSTAPENGPARLAM
jgi:hypothetical protein